MPSSASQVTAAQAARHDTFKPHLAGMGRLLGLDRSQHRHGQTKDEVQVLFGREGCRASPFKRGNAVVIAGDSSTIDDAGHAPAWRTGGCRGRRSRAINNLA